MFPDLLGTAVAALAPIAGSETVFFRIRASPSAWAGGEPVGGAWGDWVELPRPFVVDNVDTASARPASDGNRASGTLVIYGPPLPGLPAIGAGPEGAAAGVPAGTGTVLGSAVQFRAKGRDWECTAVGDWAARAGFARYSLSALDR